MEQQIRILSLVSYQILPARMGGQKSIAFFNRYLARLLPFYCISTSNNIPDGDESYPLIPMLGNSAFRYINPVYFFKIRSFIKMKKITHLIIEHPYYGWLGILLKWTTNVRLIIRSQNIEALRFKSTGKWWWGVLWNYERLTHRQAHHNFFIQDNDREYAITKFRLLPERCDTITYGLDKDSLPSADAQRSAREKVCSIHGISPTTRLLLFNGALDYLPNRKALDTILKKINPLLLSASLEYRILVCGSKLPESYNELAAYSDQHIIYAGFVKDINLYLEGCDLFINPVIEGGGIKTKVVEALGNNLSVISTKSGAIGIPPGITGKKLLTVDDDDWEGFARRIIDMPVDTDTPPAFFDHFYWGNIAAKAAATIK